MSELVTFEDKIGQLIASDQAVADLWSSFEEEGAVTLYSKKDSAKGGVNRIRKSLRFSVGCHARLEYTAQGFDEKDLRTDTAVQLQQRAGLLSLVALPEYAESGDKEAFFNRASFMTKFLGKLVTDEEIIVDCHMIEFDNYIDIQTFKGRLDRPVFVEFRDDYWASTKLLSVSQEKDEGGMTVFLPQLFEKVIYTAETPLTEPLEPMEDRLNRWYEEHDVLGDGGW